MRIWRGSGMPTSAPGLLALSPDVSTKVASAPPAPAGLPPLLPRQCASSTHCSLCLTGVDTCPALDVPVQPTVKEACGALWHPRLQAQRLGLSGTDDGMRDKRREAR